MIDIKQLTESDKGRRVLVATPLDKPGYGELICWDEEKNLVWIRQDHTKYSYAVDAKYCSFYEMPEKRTGGG